MLPQKQKPDVPTHLPERILNKNFYRFLFSFIAVVAGVLLFIVVLGVGSGIQ